MHFRLRQFRDDDLTNAFSSLPAHIEQSDLIREALRMYFFGAPTPIRDSLNIQPSEVRTESIVPIKVEHTKVAPTKLAPVIYEDDRSNIRVKAQVKVEPIVQSASVAIPFHKEVDTFDADAKLKNLFGSMDDE